mgnify:CR=1 FL=1
MSKKVFFTILILVVLSLVFLYFVKTNPKPEQSFNDEILATDVVVKITDEGFVPERVEIKVGQRVMWINESNAFTWPASDPHPTHTELSTFDPKEPFRGGEVWGYVFESPGVFKYHDHLKSSRRGEVEVSS